MHFTVLACSTDERAIFVSDMAHGMAHQHQAAGVCRMAATCGAGWRGGGWGRPGAQPLCMQLLCFLGLKNHVSGSMQLCAGWLAFDAAMMDML